MKPFTPIAVFALGLLIASPLLPASSLYGATADEGLFNGGWSKCDDDDGIAVCELIFVKQRGARICGVSTESSPNYQYRDRFIAMATGNRARIDKICGDGGSPGTSRCSGDADAAGGAVGWHKSEASLALCSGRLISSSSRQAGCGGARADEGLNRSSDAGFVDNLSAEDNQWLASCIAGRE